MEISTGKVGKISAHGEIWNAKSDEAIEKGEKIKIVAVDGMTVKVEKIKWLINNEISMSSVK